MSESEAVKRLSDASVGWIGAADNKAAALLGVSNILLGAVFLADLGPTSGWWHAIRVGFVLLVLAQHVVVAAFVLWPRTNRTAILKKAGFPTPLPRSPSFFGDVAKMPHADFKALMADVPTQAEDKLEQAYVLAVIANRKMLAYQWTIGLFVAGLVAFCTLATVELLPRAADQGELVEANPAPAKPNTTTEEADGAGRTTTGAPTNGGDAAEEPVMELPPPNQPPADNPVDAGAK